MPSNLQQFKNKTLAKPDVRAAYGELAGEFAFLDEVLKARATTGLTQAKVAKHMGTTQSAIARLASANAKHSPREGVGRNACGSAKLVAHAAMKYCLRRWHESERQAFQPTRTELVSI